MPLDPHDPIRTVRRLDCLHHTVRRARRDAQAAPQLQHRLMMPGVNFRLSRAGKSENAPVTEICSVHGIRSFASIGKLILLGTVANFRAQLSWNVLDKTAAEKNVKRLNPIADGEDGLA